MKNKILLSAFCLLLFVLTAAAQWNTNLPGTNRVAGSAWSTNYSRTNAASGYGWSTNAPGIIRPPAPVWRSATASGTWTGPGYTLPIWTVVFVVTNLPAGSVDLLVTGGSLTNAVVATLQSTNRLYSGALTNTWVDAPSDVDYIRTYATALQLRDARGTSAPSVSTNLSVAIYASARP